MALFHEEAAAPKSKPVEYHSSDFDFDEWAAECLRDESLSMPSLSGGIVDDSKASETQSSSWNDFYGLVGRGTYQPRRYLTEEFKNYLELAQDADLRVIDIGCGHGSTAKVLINALGRSRIGRYIATDCSDTCLLLLNTFCETNIGKDSVKIETAVWDITLSDWPSTPHNSSREPVIYNRAMCIFTLSAIPSEKHALCLANIASSLGPGGCILFRDYAKHDMTMYRHKIRLDEGLYQRADGTLAYYFDKEYMASLVDSIPNLRLVECEYCCVENKNRKTGQALRRVFIHAVIQVI